MLGGYFTGADILKTDIEELDVTDAEAVAAMVERHRPEAFLHLAAMTDVDACQLHPDRARRLNVDATENVARVCAHAGTTMVYVSTAQVFDGRKHEGYTETDTPAPVNVYGETKLAGEEIVRGLVPRHYIVRTSWLMGGGPQTDKKFVGKLLMLMEERSELKVVDDKFGSPTYARHLADTVLALVESGRFGTYHVAAGGACSRFELAQALVALTGRNTRVERVPSSAFPLPAPRPDSEVLLTNELPRAGVAPPPSWWESLATYLREWSQ